ESSQRSAAQRLRRRDTPGTHRPHAKETTMKVRAIAAGLVVILVAGARAERPPEPRDDARLVVVGTVKKVTTKKSEFGGDGVRTDYTAEVAVDRVEKGEGVKPGETV